MSVPQIVVVVTRIDGLADTGARSRDRLDADVAGAMEDGRPHRLRDTGLDGSGFGDDSHVVPPDGANVTAILSDLPVTCSGCGSASYAARAKGHDETPQRDSRCVLFVRSPRRHVENRLAAPFSG